MKLEGEMGHPIIYQKQETNITEKFITNKLWHNKQQCKKQLNI